MSIIATLAACLLFAACSIPGDVQGPSDAFPKDGFLGGWMRDGKAEVFEGANLYGHIDGGAEVYLELGFDKLVLQRYAWDDDELDLELYWMADPVSSLGIYLMNCGEEKRNHALNARHTADRYQIQLLKGGAYLKVNNQSITPKAAEALVHFAQYVEQRLPDGEPADLLDLLPEEGRIKGTERILRGPFTFEQVCDIGPGDFLQLKGSVFAVAADFTVEGGEASTWIMIDYPDDAAVKAAFSHAASNLYPRFERIAKEDSRLVFKDAENRYGVIFFNGSRMNVKTNLAAKP